MVMTRFTIAISLSLVVCCLIFPTSRSFVFPLSLRLWRNQIEVSLRTVQVQHGSAFSVTCDGTGADRRTDPHLRWYGPDKYWISSEGSHNRIYVEKSFSRRYLKLHISNAKSRDSGLYVCRGWLGPEKGWDITSIRIQVLGERRPQRIEAVTTRSPRRPPIRTPRPSIIHAHPMTEVPSEMTTEGRCEAPMFQCVSGECFANNYVCDSFPDCADGSDEQNCEARTCTEGMIACEDGHGCVSTDQICDGIRQCTDNSDENPDVCNRQ